MGRNAGAFHPGRLKKGCSAPGHRREVLEARYHLLSEGPAVTRQIMGYDDVESLNMCLYSPQDIVVGSLVPLQDTAGQGTDPYDKVMTDILGLSPRIMEQRVDTIDRRGPIGRAFKRPVQHFLQPGEVVPKPLHILG